MKTSLYAGSLRAELESLLRADPSLERLVERQSDEPEVASIELLCAGPSPYFLVHVPIPGRKGSVWASRLPGSRPAYTEDEVGALVRFGIDRVVCLVPTEAIENLHGAYRYLPVVRALFPERFHQLEVPDHAVPPSDEDFEELLGRIDDALWNGERVLVHCVGGCGRTGTFVACLMVRAGLDPVEAIRRFRRHRRCGPETGEQVAYVVRYGGRLLERARRKRESEPGQVRLSRDREGSPRLLARGGLGSVYVGRLHFRGGGSRRVAIKRFHQSLQGRDAELHERRILALRDAGVRLPRMFMVRLEDGSWAQVSPLFGSLRAGSKLWQPGQFYKTLSREQKHFAVDQLTRAANAGYAPSIDLFVIFRDPAKGIIPLDLDLVEREPKAVERARKLMRAIVQLGSSARERDELLEAASAAATSPTQAAIVESLDGPKNPFRSLWNLQ